MKATFYYITETGITTEFMVVPVGDSNKKARSWMQDYLGMWSNEGWSIKEEGEWEVTLHKGLNDRTMKIVVEN